MGSLRILAGSWLAVAKAIALVAVGAPAADPARGGPPDSGPGSSGRAPSAAGTLELRAEPFTVPPSSGPVTHVAVRNAGEATFSGAISLRLPGRARAVPDERIVTLRPGAATRVAFTVEAMVDRAENRYPVLVRAIGGGSDIEERQEIVCASAPSFSPEIDGDLEDWEDAIPVAWGGEDRRVVARTAWDRRFFYLAVEVTEERLAPPAAGDLARGGDALQIAFASRSATTGHRVDDVTRRHEFLIVAADLAASKGRCLELTGPGRPLISVLRPRADGGREAPGARVGVRRSPGRTAYECAIPFALLAGSVRPSVGREFRFSLLVHDPDGTGPRDLGRALGLRPRPGDRFAWCAWRREAPGGEPPRDSKLEWGLCSSKH